MEIKRSISQPSRKGPGQKSHRLVRIDPLFDPQELARAYGASETFEPGARTAWHTQPLGQMLIVTAGCGSDAMLGEPQEEIRPGDVILCPPGKKHWHGGRTAAMPHITIVEKLKRRGRRLEEKVGDEQYQAD